jgi:hypothetical protein
MPSKARMIPNLARPGRTYCGSRIYLTPADEAGWHRFFRAGPCPRYDGACRQPRVGLEIHEVAIVDTQRLSPQIEPLLFTMRVFVKCWFDMKATE